MSEIEEMSKWGVDKIGEWCEEDETEWVRWIGGASELEKMRGRCGADEWELWKE